MSQTKSIVPLGVLCGVVALIAIFILTPFVQALLWATVLTLLTSPLYQKLKNRWSKSPERGETLAAIVMTIGTGLILCLPFIVLGGVIYLQIQSLGGELNKDTFETWITQIDKAAAPILNTVGVQTSSLRDLLTENRDEIIAAIKTPATQFAKEAGKSVFTIIIALLTQFFMLRDGHRLRQPAIELSPLAPERTASILDRVEHTVHAVFIGTVLVAMLQGAVIGITYALVGIPNAVLLGVISGVLAMIPLLGAPVIYVPVGLFLISQGQYSKAAIVLGVGFIIVSNIDNALRPFLIGARVSLHPMGIFFSILGGVVVFGPIGVMVGPILLTIALGLIEELQAQNSSQLAH